MLHSARGQAVARHSARRARQRGPRALLRSAPQRRECPGQHRDAPAEPRGPRAACLQRVAGSPVHRWREAAWSPRLAAPAERWEMGLPRAALRVSALPQAQTESASARRQVPSRAAWRRRAALPSARRVAASEWPGPWAQRVALPRLATRVAACAPAVPWLAVRCVLAEPQWRARAAAYAQAEPRSAASARAALLPEVELDARAQQLEVAASGVRAERQLEAAASAAPVQQPEAVASVVPERWPAGQMDVQAEPRRGAEAVQAVSAQRPAVPVSAPASAFRPGQLPPSSPLVPRRAARFARAMRSWLAASPSMRSWQAAQGEGLS